MKNLSGNYRVSQTTTPPHTNHLRNNPVPNIPRPHARYSTPRLYLKPFDDETRGSTGLLVQHKQKSSQHVAKIPILHVGRAVLEGTNDQEPEVTRSILGG